jgi:hypothetical protein
MRLEQADRVESRLDRIEGRLDLVKAFKSMDEQSLAHLVKAVLDVGEGHDR